MHDLLGLVSQVNHLDGKREACLLVPCAVDCTVAPTNDDVSKRREESGEKRDKKGRTNKVVGHLEAFVLCLALWVSEGGRRERETGREKREVGRGIGRVPIRVDSHLQGLSDVFQRGVKS